MSAFPRLLRHTASRSYLVALGSRFHRAILACAAVFLVLFLAARLLAVIPDRFTFATLAAIPATALVVALLSTRRPTERAAARLLDTRSGSKELFLTAVLGGEAPGDFRSIVAAQAEERAAGLRAAKIVPFHWQRGFRDLALVLAVLAAAIQFLPHLDPFRKQEERQKIAETEQELRETRKATAIRAEQLAKDSARQAEEVKLALDQLDKTLQQARPEKKEATLKELADDQKRLGEMWRKVSSDLPRFDAGSQSFGAADSPQMKEWRDQLKKGDVSQLKKELSAIREELAKLAEMSDSAEKRALQEKLTQKLNELAQAMKQELNSPQVAEALQRALDQMDRSKVKELAKEATQGALDSLQLSRQELDQLAQSIADGKALEEALKTLQMAKQLAQNEKLDGQGAEGAMTMEDYEKLFREKLASLGEGQPGGQPGNGPGIGDGSKRPEDESTKTDFKSEKSPSKLAGGKLLMEWRTKEVGETGQRTEEYREALQKVKQGVSEAIQQEQVPPGYHDAIKKYFDSLPENANAK